MATCWNHLGSMWKLDQYYLIVDRENWRWCYTLCSPYYTPWYVMSYSLCPHTLFSLDVIYVTGLGLAMLLYASKSLNIVHRVWKVLLAKINIKTTHAFIYGKSTKWNKHVRIFPFNSIIAYHLDTSSVFHVAINIIINGLLINRILYGLKCWDYVLLGWLLTGKY